MKIIVFSDSHRDLDHMRQVVKREQPGTVIHLGDHDTDAERLGREFPQLPLICVRGNCDGWSDTPLTLTIVLDIRQRTSLTHCKADCCWLVL